MTMPQPHSVMRRQTASAFILTHATVHRGRKLILVGPKPPDDFKDDGCSMSPDGWWKPACRVHDWEYELIRQSGIYQEIEKIDRARGQIKKINADLRSGPVWEANRDEIYAIGAEIDRLTSKAKHMRRTADRNLKENIRRCSEGSKLKWARAWYISRIYYRGVRLGAHPAAKTKPHYKKEGVL